MILDLIVVGIFVIATIRGKFSGFLESIIRFLALAGALVLGVAFTPSFAEFLYSTNLDEELIERLNLIAEDGMINLADCIPSVIAKTFESLEELSIRVTVLHFTNVAITILSFMIIVVSVWIIATFVIMSLRKSKRQKGLIGSVDSSVGLLIGAIKGLVLVFLFLAFMFPVTGIFMPEKLQALNDMLETSIVAGYLYDMNPLLIFMKNLHL